MISLSVVFETTLSANCSISASNSCFYEELLRNGRTAKRASLRGMAGMKNRYHLFPICPMVCLHTFLERNTGFEPALSAWRADMLPLTPIPHEGLFLFFPRTTSISYAPVRRCTVFPAAILNVRNWLLVTALYHYRLTKFSGTTRHASQIRTDTAALRAWLYQLSYCEIKLSVGLEPTT